jgi:adenylate cyclase
MVNETQRRLAAILAADVAGYTRLVELDTDGTVAAWKSARDDVIKPLVENKSGHIIKFTGDGFLVEFPSVQDAVVCAITLQEELKSSSLNFRMGINVGDITDDGGDVHGEGVNIAARLEALAEPGGICISGDVYNQVRNRIDAVFKDMGEQEVKHVSRPVSVYAINPTKQKTSDHLTSPTLALPDKPSIAVLPFTNMSGDPEQEYFSDGITEDIISELSLFRDLFVIAKNSSFVFKGENISLSEVASKLGVQYVIEGSVRKAGNRVRITAQLVDAATASQIWADRYDREIEDIFAVQDEVVAAIVSALPNQIRHVELARLQRSTADIRAYDLVLHATAQGLNTLEDATRAIALLEQALEIEPDYALAHSWLSAAYAMEWDFRLIPKPEAIVAKIMKHSLRAVELDQTDGYAYMVLSDNCLFIMEDLTQARVYAERAVQLNPNSSPIVVWRGYIHNCDGESKQAMELCARATRLDPLAFGWVKFLQGVVYFDAGQYDQAIDMFLASNWEEKWGHLAAAYALIGQTDRACEIAKRTRQMWIESSPQDLDERIQELFFAGGWYHHGNLDGSFEKGMRIAGFLR